MTLISRAGRSRRIVAGLTLSAAAVAATFTGHVSPADPLQGAAAAADSPTPQAEIDPWAIGEYGPGSNPVADHLAAPVQDRSLRAPVSVAARGAGAAARLFRPANIPTATYDDLPAAALAAYQRAAVVLEAADRRCAVDWQLIAAVGRVRSDHGRSDGGTLAPSGVVRPALVGRRLDGRRGTPRISDTDAGQLDGDRRFDRTVGPMQVLPSTWSVVGVDADGDGKRNAQDVDDAALSSAVHLCSGEERLDTRAGRRAALLRLDRTGGWVDLVLRVHQDYLADTPTMPETPTRTWSAAPGLGAWEIDDPAALLKEAEQGLDKGARNDAKKGAKSRGTAAKARGKGADRGKGTLKARSKAKSKAKAKSTSPATSKAPTKAPTKARTPGKDPAKSKAPTKAIAASQDAKGPGKGPGKDPGKDPAKDPAKDPVEQPKEPSTGPKDPAPEPTSVECPDGSKAASRPVCPGEPATPEPPADPKASTQPSSSGGGGKSERSPDPKPTSPPKASASAEAAACGPDPDDAAGDPGVDADEDDPDCEAARKE